MFIIWRLLLGYEWKHVFTSPFSSRTLLGTDPCKPHAYYSSLCVPETVCTSLLLSRSWFLEALHTLCFLHSFTSFSPGFPSPYGRDLMETSHLWLCVPGSFILHILWLWVFIPICCRRKLLWKLTKALIYKQRRISLGVVLLLHSSKRTVVFDFPLGIWPI